MIAQEDYWLAKSRGSRIVDLDREESLQLLAVKSVGRLAFMHDGTPHVLPMNFVVVNDQVVVRTLAHGVVAQAVDSTVSFEVDDIDDFLEAGWSVVVTGTARLLTEAEYADVHDQAPDPWAGGPRTLFVKIPIEQITGRQVAPS